MRRTTTLTGLALIAASLMACGSAAGGSPGPVHVASAIRPLVVGMAANRRTLRVRVGTPIIVRLDTLMWTFHRPSGPAVRQRGPQRLVRQTRGCRAPQGCGYVEIRAAAVARGRSVIRATRGFCGEGYLCPPADRTFVLTIRVM